MLDNAGTLTISGKGAMEDYILGSPWAKNEDSITKLVIEEGVTTIGASAFHSNKNLISVTLPNTLTTIGSCAFAFCENLDEITFTGNVPSFGEDCFNSVTATIIYQLHRRKSTSRRSKSSA